MDIHMQWLIVALVILVIGVVLCGLVFIAKKKKDADSTKKVETAAPLTETAESTESTQEGEPQREESPLAPASQSRDIPENSSSRMQRLRSRLAGSSHPFGKALFSILTRDNLSESDWEEVEDTLLLADVGTDTSMDIVEELRRDARVQGSKDTSAVRELLRTQLLEAVNTDKNGHAFNRELELRKSENSGHPTHVIMMVGVNGSGKTTTTGKLSRLLVGEGTDKIILGAADTFRAAAADQLETWAQRVGVPVVRSDKDGADPASVAFEAAEKAETDGVQVLIVDTAGRLQNKTNLMDELGKIRRVVEKKLPVEEVLLVLDATTGQNGMMQAKVFAEAIGITGIVLTKLDGSAKGGVVISVQRELGVPVKLVGLGEGADDLAPFDPEGFVGAILGE